MPWKESCILDQRLQFLSTYQKEEMSVADLCRAYGISRPTAYRWINRYNETGPERLVDRSRRPHTCSHATLEPMENAILALAPPPQLRSYTMRVLALCLIAPLAASAAAQTSRPAARPAPRSAATSATAPVSAKPSSAAAAHFTAAGFNNEDDLVRIYTGDFQSIKLESRRHSVHDDHLRLHGGLWQRLQAVPSAQ
jgi:DNA-binding transcriptional ArsR family regulator